MSDLERFLLGYALAGASVAVWVQLTLKGEDVGGAEWLPWARWCAFPWCLVLWPVELWWFLVAGFRKICGFLRKMKK